MEKNIKYLALSYEKQQEAISYFDKLPLPIREIPSERNPRPVPGGYLVRGTSMVKKSSRRKEDGNKEQLDDDEGGDLLMNVIEKKITSSSLASKIRVYYILDPTPKFPRSVACH